MTNTHNSSSRRLGWMIASVPCTSKKALRTNSQKGIGEILNAKLTTIVEEPENFHEASNSNTTATKVIGSNIINLKFWSKGKKKGNDLVHSAKLFKKSNKLQLVSHNLCVKGSYVRFLAGFVAKGSLNGLPRFN